MNIHLQKSSITDQQSVIKITGSKSESNRLLLLQALYPNLQIENLSNSDDTHVMSEALSTSANINALSCSENNVISCLALLPKDKKANETGGFPSAFIEI